jgi:cyclopropane fatty-acyl-phospholipid synthase-like methyltransferase
VRFDLELFHQLQDEYRDRPIVPTPRSLTDDALTKAARARAAALDKRVGVRGKRVLEVGCGGGHTCRVLADEYDCEVVGVDIFASDAWSARPDLALHKHDIATLDNDFLGTFDVITSYAVWEHVEHPYAALQATRDLLRPDGRMFMVANLYRGPKASHRYRQIWFPWPHLLFSDDVIAEYYQYLSETGQRTSDNALVTRSAWVNKLTAAHYLTYFDRLDFTVEKLWWTKSEIDEDFYRRFEDILGRYPRYDLERDFINVILTPRENKPLTVKQQAALRRRVGRLSAKVDRLTVQRDRQRRRARQMEASLSWRVTRPLRAVRRRLGRRG